MPSERLNLHNFRVFVLISYILHPFPDPGRSSESRRIHCSEVPRCVWHHHYHGENRRAQESVQRTGGRSPEADELCLSPDWSLWLHEAILHTRNWKWVSLSKYKDIVASVSSVAPANLTSMPYRCWNCDAPHGGLYHRCHGCGFCTTDRCGESALPSPGTTAGWWEEIQQHH